jgi:hypothetical protein
MEAQCLQQVATSPYQLLLLFHLDKRRLQDPEDSFRAVSLTLLTLLLALLEEHVLDLQEMAEKLLRQVPISVEKLLEATKFHWGSRDPVYRTASQKLTS